MLTAITSGWTWLVNTEWARNLSIVCAAIVAFLIGEKMWRANIEKGVRRVEREAAARRSAEAEAKIITKITENSNELVRESERVRAHDSAVVLPDGTAGLKPYDYRD